MIDSSVIKEFSPSFQPYIRQVILGDIGISAGSIQILEIRSSIRLPPNSRNTTSTGDRFKVLIPYAGHYIKWDVVFNSKDPKFKPDFSFSDDFLSDPDEDQIEKEVPSFFKWDYRNDKALLQVLRELLALYTKYQVALVEQYDRPYFEYNGLIAAFNASEVEVLIGSGDSARKSRSTGGGGGGINFLIALRVDFTSLPPGFENINYSKDRALLHVMFHSTDVNRITPELFLSPNLEIALGKTYSIFLPPLHTNSCLMDYVPLVTKMLQERIATIITAFEKRKEYIAILLESLPGLIEYDSLTFFMASFLLDHNDFHCLLHITISEKFPTEKPSYVFQSVYHVVNGRPYEMQGNDFPYSPRWTPSEMVTRALSYSLTFVEQFQKVSVEALQNQKENKN